MSSLLSKHMDVATHILKDDSAAIAAIAKQQKRGVLMNMNKLPLEMLDQILAYEGRFRIRNGKLMRLIPKNDPRKIVLSKITQLKYNKKTTTLYVVLLITKYKFFEISNTCTPTHIDMHLRTIFNCRQNHSVTSSPSDLVVEGFQPSYQTGIVLNSEFIHYILEP